MQWPEKIHAEMQTWAIPPERLSGDVLCTTPNELNSSLNLLRTAFSAMLSLEREFSSLLISASSGQFIVSLFLGDDVYDLKGCSEEGEVPLVVGGQEIS